MQVPYSFQSPHFQQQTQSGTVLVAPPAEQPITQKGYTVSAFPLLLSFLLQRHNYSQELYPPLTLLFPLTGKKMNLHLLSRFASAELMLHQATLSDFQKMGREFA